MQWLKYAALYGGGLAAIGLLDRVLDPSTSGEIGLVTTITMGVLTLTIYWKINSEKRWVDADGNSTKRALDVTSEQRESPKVIRPGIERLSNLGFRRLGELATVTTEGKEVGCEWVFIDADGEIIVNLAPMWDFSGKVMFGFQTIFPDYARLITCYPSRFPYNDELALPDLRTRHTAQSIEHSYNLHRTELENFRQAHGSPAEINSMADVAALDSGLRKRHWKMITRRLHLINRVTLYLSFGFTLISLFAALVSAVAPALAITIYALEYSTYMMYISFVLPSSPSRARLFRIYIGLLLLLLLPLSIGENEWAGIHVYLLSFGMIAYVVLVPGPRRHLSTASQPD